MGLIHGSVYRWGVLRFDSANGKAGSLRGGAGAIAW